MLFISWNIWKTRSAVGLAYIDIIIYYFFLQFFLHWPLCLQSLQLVLLQVALHSVHFLQSAPQPAFFSAFLSQQSAFFSAFLSQQSAFFSAFLSQQSAFFSAFFLQQSFFSAFLSQHSFFALGLLSVWAFTVVVENHLFHISLIFKWILSLAKIQIFLWIALCLPIIMYLCNRKLQSIQSQPSISSNSSK